MGTRVVNGATGSEQVEREALFFAVLRERASSVGAVGSPGESAGRRLSRVDEEITAWLEEADEEGERILEQARTEAARLRLEAHHHAEQLRLAAERGAGDARRQRDTLLREGERAAAQRAAEAAEGAAAVLGDAERAADQRLVAADRASAWVRAQAEADARAATNRAAATVAGIQSEVRALHEQLLRMVDQANALLPALEAAAETMALPPPRPAEPAIAVLEAPRLEGDEGVDREPEHEPEMASLADEARDEIIDLTTGWPDGDDPEWHEPVSIVRRFLDRLGGRPRH